MKKILTTFLSFVLVSSFVLAQSSKPLSKIRSSVKVQQKKVYTGLEEVTPNDLSVPPAQYRLVDYVIGNTFYDLQTNASMPSRLVKHSDNRLSSVWTTSPTIDFASRGSGYNTSDANHAFGPITDSPIESSRTGFTSICVTDDGTEHVFTHSGAGVIQHTYRASGATDWTQEGIPHQTSPGGLWARSAASGNYLHVIYLTIPSGNGGTAVDNLDGNLLYCRSSDGGATWDKIDIRLPGVDSTVYNGISAEDYAIDANGPNVTIGVFPTLGDVAIVASNDNGDTWTNHSVYDFPFNKFTWGDAYDYDLISSSPALIDTFYAPNDSSLFCSNGHGAVLVDNDGVSHVFFSAMFLYDEDFSDESMSTFPLYDAGVVYWNSNMQGFDYTNANEMTIAGYMPDNDGDNMLWPTGSLSDNYTEYRYDAVTAQPSAGMDANGNLYLCFGAPHDGHLNSETATLNRKAFLSSAAGPDYDTWTDPIEVAQESNSDIGLLPFQEHIYPVMCKVVDDSVNVIVQVDYTQGTNLNQDNDDLNLITYFGVAVDQFVSNKVVIQKDVQMSLTPNPATDNSLVQFNLNEATQGRINVYDMNGRLVFASTTNDFNTGKNSFRLNTAELGTGIYLVQLNTEKFISTQKLVVSNK